MLGLFRPTYGILLFAAAGALSVPMLATAALAAGHGNAATSRHHGPASVCCGFAQSAFSGAATAIAVGGGQEWILDNASVPNGHNLYQNVSGSWVLYPSPGGIEVAADTSSGAPYLLIKSNKITYQSGSKWIGLSSGSPLISFIGNSHTAGLVDAVGTVPLSGGGYQYYECFMTTNGICVDPSTRGGPPEPPGGSLLWADSPNYGWNVNDASKAYMYSGGSWVYETGVKPVSLAYGGDGTWAVGPDGKLFNWDGSTWNSISAPANLTAVSVGPNHIWVIDSSGDIFWK